MRNKASLFKMNLQLFAGKEDAILPDDFNDDVSDQPGTDTDSDQNQDIDDNDSKDVDPDNNVDDNQSDADNQDKDPEPFLKIKFNHEEKGLTLEEAQILAQKGMNYDKIHEKLTQLESDPSRPFVEAQAAKYGMTVDQYLEAVKQEEEKAELDKLVKENIPEEYAKEILENRKFRQQYQDKEKESQKKQQEQQEFNEFLQAFPDVKGEEIPKEVWEMRDNGVPLKYAYMQHENNLLKQKAQIEQQNEANKKKAPITSVTEHGTKDDAEEDDFLKGFNSI